MKLINKKKPKIGVVSLGHYIYFQQFEDLREELEIKSDEFISMIDKNLYDIFYAGYIDNVESSFNAVQDIKKQDIDILFVILSTYVPSAVAFPFIFYIDAPHVLVAIQPKNHLDYKNTTTYMQLVNDDVCAMPEIAGVYQRVGRDVPPCIIAAKSQTDYIQKEISEWLNAVSAKVAFKYSTIGYLGHTYEGMYDMHTDPTAFSSVFGCHVKMLEMCELAQYAETVANVDLNEKIEIIKQTFDICNPSNDPLTDFVKHEDLEYSAKMACALDKLIENNNLSALAYYYKGENNNIYEQIAANLIIGNTLLTSNGIPLAGEADLKTAAAMLIMNRIGGGGSFAELHPFDITDNICLVGHDGPHNISISNGKPRLRKLKKYHGKSGSGLGVEFSLKSGAITMLSISVDKNGKLKMVATTGESINGEIPQTGNTNTRVKFNYPVTEFLSRWCEAGPTHHFALGCGNHLETLKKYSKISGIELIIV